MRHLVLGVAVAIALTIAGSNLTIAPIRRQGNLPLSAAL